MRIEDIDFATAYGAVQHAGHRSPRCAGSADRYYGRKWEPNFSYNYRKFTQAEMTPEMVAEYTEGWENETDRKEWL